MKIDKKNVVVTYNQVNLRLYMDGVEEKTNETTATPETNTQPLNVGKNPLTFKKGYYDGYMDEVYVWNNDLTAGEVLALYQSGTIPQTSNIVYSNTFGGSGNETNFIKSLTNSQTALADVWQNNHALMILIIGVFITKWTNPKFGNWELEDIELDSSDNVYVTDRVKNEIFKFVQSIYPNPSN